MRNSNITYLHPWRISKRLSAVRYAYGWCLHLSDWDPTMTMGMGDDVDMTKMYLEYVALARHMGQVMIRFQLAGDVIQPVDFDTWYNIFWRVFDKFGD